MISLMAKKLQLTNIQQDGPVTPFVDDVVLEDFVV